MNRAAGLIEHPLTGGCCAASTFSTTSWAVMV